MHSIREKKSHNEVNACAILVYLLSQLKYELIAITVHLFILPDLPPCPVTEISPNKLVICVLHALFISPDLTDLAHQPALTLKSRVAWL